MVPVRILKIFKILLLAGAITGSSSCVRDFPESNWVQILFLDALINPAPTALAYPASPYTFTKDLPIATVTPTLTGNPTSCTSDPALPAGLVLDQTTCAMSGTPTTFAAYADYVITASNSKGSIYALVGITVNIDPPSGLTFSSPSYTFTQNYAVTTITPSVTGTISSCTASPGLPAGLSLNNTTCAISGTPTALQASTSYTITATNPYGSTTATINITVSIAIVLTINVTGLQATDTISVEELVNSAGSPITITGPSPASGTFTLPSTGGTYNFKLGAFTNGNPGTNSDKVCAMKDAQFGSTTVPITLNINCTPGYHDGRSLNTVPQSKLDYRLYQGKVVTLKASSGNRIPGMVHLNGFLYFYEKGVNTFNKMAITGGAITSINLTTVDGAAVSDLRHPVTDGTYLYFSDWTNSRILKFDTAGTWIASFPIGVVGASGLALDQSRQILYIAIRNTTTIKRLNLFDGTFLGDITANIDNPECLTLMNNKLYVTNVTGTQIIEITSPEGTPTSAVYAGSVSGFQDGPRLSAKMQTLFGITTDGTDLYFGGAGIRFRKISSKTGIVSTIAGDGLAGGTDGTGIGASFSSNINGITTDGRNFYVCDQSGAIAKITDNGLVGYWPLAGNAFDYNSDGLSVKDAAWSGTKSYADGRFSDANNSASFNGASGLTAGDTGLPDASTPRSLCAWIKPNTLPANTGETVSILFYGKDLANQRSNLAFFHDGISLFLRYGISSNFFQVPIQVTSPYNWMHICAIYGNQKISLYLNAHLLGSTAFTSVATSLSGTMYIGQTNVGTGYFNGTIADVRIYNRMINEGEINELAQDANSALVGQSYNNGASGLLSHYSFDDDGTSNPSYADYGPLNSTLIGYFDQPAAGKDGDAFGAMYYNGISAYLRKTTVVGLPVLTHPRTLCAWVNPAQYGPGNQLAVAYGEATTAVNSAYSTFGIGIGATGLTQNWTGAEEIIGTTVIPLNTWTHICINYDGGTNGTARTYINGKFEISGTYTLATPAGPGDLVVGSRADNLAPFPGKIDDVRIYNNALSATQIRQLAVQVPTGLVARYDFTGDATDVSGFGTNLTSTVSFVNDRFGQVSAAGFGGTSATTATTSLAAHFPYGSNPRTQCAWVNKTGVNTGSIMGYGVAAAGQTSLLRWNNTNTAAFTPFADATYHGVTSVSSQVTGVWQHVCATYSGTSSQIFINGVQTGTTATGSPWITTISGTGNFSVGNEISGSTYFNGDIDDVRVYNRALLANEIRALSGYHPMQVTTWNAAPASSSLKVHFAADSATCSGATCTGGGSVDAWADRSGNGINLGQTNPARRPVFNSAGFNNRPAVTFNRTNDTVMSAASTPWPTTRFTIFTVMNRTAASGSSDYIAFSDNNLTSWSYGMFFQANNTISNDNIGIQPREASLTAFAPSPNPFIFSRIEDGNVVNNWSFFNGKADGGGAAFSWATGYVGTNLNIGGSEGVANIGFTGDLAEFLFFNTEASGINMPAADREIVECYLSAKYGIAIGHTCP